MTLLVDYRCVACGARAERWVPSPPPGTITCAACDGDARRVWAPVGLGGRAGTIATPSPAPAAGSLCQRFPQIPALCMMTPSAQRRMVAAYTGDHRARDQEIARQAAAAAVRPPTMADAISHHHRPAVSPAPDAK
jgi:hypothetical protein